MGSKVIRNVTKILKATSGRLFGRVTAGTGRAEELTPAEARTVLELGTLATQSGTFSGTSSGTNTGDQNLFSTIVVAGQSDVVADATGDTLTLVAGTNISITTNAGSDSITINNTASGLSGTGSVDNAVLRADGTGGATLQNSAFVIADNATASPNNTVNHASIQATGGTTNVSVSIVPKAAGAFCLAVPDGTAAGGNVRGANAVDLQTSRGAAAQVASGAGAAIVGGTSGTASGTGAIVLGGSGCTASGIQSMVGGFSSSGTHRCAVVLGYESSVNGSDGVALGMRNVAGLNAFAVGRNCTASGEFDAAIGGYNTANGGSSLATGTSSLANKYCQHAHAAGAFATAGDAQNTRFVLRNKTTNNTATTLFINGSSARLTIPSGKIMFADVLVSGIKSDGSAAACYKRKVAIKNVGGTTTLVGSVETIGTDHEDNASTDVAITADDTNDALDISVTGITAETWRWVAVVEGVEIAYGT